MLPKPYRIIGVEEENPTTKTFTLDCPDTPLPGRFYMAWLPGIEQKPLSVSGIRPLKFSVCSVGPFSKAFCSLRIGDKIWLSGPYGNAFTLHGKKVMLVGGGYGTGPMRYLAQLAALNGIEPVIVMGARNKERLMKHPGNVRTFVSTDDGSEGRKGMVTELINHLLGLEKFDAIYACGPEKMMGAIAKIAEEKGIKCQLLLERFMKCGFGMCGQCSIGEGLVCVDGPVYDSSIAKHPEFGKFHRDRCGLKVKL